MGQGRRRVDRTRGCEGRENNQKLLNGRSWSKEAPSVNTLAEGINGNLGETRARIPPKKGIVRRQFTLGFAFLGAS